MSKIKIEVLPKTIELKPVLVDILKRSDTDFVLPLSSRLDFGIYAEKVLKSAVIIGAWDETYGNTPKRLLGAYIGYAESGYDYAFGAYMWVDENYRQYFLGISLHSEFVKYCKNMGMAGIKAKTWIDNNLNLIQFYKRLKYEVSEPIFDGVLNRYEVELTLRFF